MDVPPTTFASDERFKVTAVTLGGVREVAGFSRVTAGVGASGTINLVPSPLRDTYSSRTPLGAMLFVRLRPSSPRVQRLMDQMHMHERSGPARPFTLGHG